MVNVMNLVADPAIRAMLACALSLLFSLVAAHKLFAPVAFRTTLAAYAILPNNVNAIVARLLPWLEICIALALLHPQSRFYAAFAAALLLGVYGAAIGVALMGGRAIADCGCSFGDDRQAIQWALVWRNLLLALIALGLAFIEMTLQRQPNLRTLSAYDMFTIVLGMLVAGVMYALTNILIANHYRLQELFRD